MADSPKRKRHLLAGGEDGKREAKGSGDERRRLLGSILHSSLRFPRVMQIKHLRDHVN